MREIGSEFHFFKSKCAKTGNNLFYMDHACFVFSGRTAIEEVLKNEKNIKKAMLPSYCCDSIIEPFRNAGIEVCFFSVSFDKKIKIDIDIPDDVDCLFWCNYFGFEVPMPDLVRFKNRGGIVIEDITHSLLSVKQSHNCSDYLVASLRKWEPVLCGGYFVTTKDVELSCKFNQPSDTFLSDKIKAMKMKQLYLAGDKDVDKAVFLTLFSKSNKWLADNYSGLAIDTYSKKYLLSVDYQKQKEIRTNNAKILYEGLKNNQYIDFLFHIESMDCPLFVPIIISDGKRDILRRKLIDNKIYCPIHWPHPKEECQSNLYDLELSLICDQRYNEDDMNWIVEVLNN